MMFQDEMNSVEDFEFHVNSILVTEDEMFDELKFALAGQCIVLEDPDNNLWTLTLLEAVEAGFVTEDEALNIPQVLPFNS